MYFTQLYSDIWYNQINRFAIIIILTITTIIIHICIDRIRLYTSIDDTLCNSIDIYFR
jgi:hypothetical protein